MLLKLFKFKHIVLVFLLELCILRSGAQNSFVNRRSWYLKPAVNYGFIWEHRATIGHLIQGYVPMLELNLVNPSYGNKLWQVENNKPDYGLNFSYIDFANPKVLGRSFSVAPFIEIPLNKIEKQSRVIVRVSWGLAYITKKFDILTNHKDIAIGSHWNAFVQYRFLWHLNLGKNYSLEPGLSLTHVSNGRSQVPNLGLNLISLHMGLALRSRETKGDVPKVDSTTKASSRHEMLFWYGYGVNEKDPPGGPKYNAHTVSLNYFFNKRNTHKFGFGTDLFYEEIHFKDLEDYHLPNTTLPEKLRVGAKFNYSYNVGCLSFPIEMGYYVYSQLNADGNIFHRFGVRYTGKKGLMVHFSLKTHWAIAHHFETGVGYRIPLKKKTHVKG